MVGAVRSLLAHATTVHRLKHVFYAACRCQATLSAASQCQQWTIRSRMQLSVGGWPDNMSTCKRRHPPVCIVVHGVCQRLRGLQRLQPLAEVEAHRAQRPVLLPHGFAHAPWPPQHRQVVEQQRQHPLDVCVPCMWRSEGLGSTSHRPSHWAQLKALPNTRSGETYRWCSLNSPATQATQETCTWHHSRCCWVA